MTNWDNIVSDDFLNSAKALRSKTFITKKERKSSLFELEQEGWFKCADFKDQRFIKVKKVKTFDEIFEDKIWMFLANLGFSDMNADRSFKMQYDFSNSNITQQIDVFAADDETVLIVECKSSQILKEGIFKKPIEAFYGQMDGLRKEAQKRYPKAKVKFIWATNNYTLNRADLNKLKEWNIAYFNEATIDYYTELVKHLGSCARYQLLGNLFANQEIRNMDNKIPAIQGKMGGHTYYSFSIEPEKLLKIGYVLHRNEANKNMMPTYQRLIKKKRLNEVHSFIKQGGYFPNSIIISIDSENKGLRFDKVQAKSDSALSKLGILHLPKKYRSAYIIDGQHRLYGYSDTIRAENNSIPVVAFINLERDEQIKLFMDINENQKAVSKTLRVTLQSDMFWVSNDYNERRQALRSKIAQMLGEEETSPLFGRVLVGENEKNAFKCITIEAIQAALKKCDFFTQFHKKNEIKQDGTFDVGENDQTCSLFYSFIEGCLKHIKTNVEEEWAKNENENGILTINRGIHGVIRVINDIVNHLISIKKINPKIHNEEDLLNEVAFYIDPLIDFFRKISSDERKELRRFFGGGADARFWRTFQKAIADSRDDFRPEGMEKYWEDAAKIYNSESFSMINEIEEIIKKYVKNKLQLKYGESWFRSGVPKPVYDEANKMAADRNYSNADDQEDVKPWNCLYLIDYKKIAAFGTNWSDIFETWFTRPGEDRLSKDKKTEWLEKINMIRNKCVHNHGVTKEDFDYLIDIYRWLKKKDA